MKFGRFSKTWFLREVGRDLLGRFFARFEAGLAEKQVSLPSPNLEEEAYFYALTKVFMAPEGLPEDLIEALYAVEGMATTEGIDRLERACERGEIAVVFAPDSSRGDLAIQAYLADPDFVAQKNNELRLGRLARFEYFSSKVPLDRSGSFRARTEKEVVEMTADLDEWFQRNNRGVHTANIEPYEMDGEFWFLLRHGDTFARMARVEKGKVHMLHFRPAKDDVVVYSPVRDELRVHAGTKREKEFYLRTFGARLFKNEDYFSERMDFTLEPLRRQGADALDWKGGGVVDRIVLVEFGYIDPDGFKSGRVHHANDIFAAAAAKSEVPIPADCLLVKAAFEFHFKGLKKPRKVEVRLPNTLKLGPHCDAALIQRWLSEKGFRAATPAGARLNGVAKLEIHGASNGTHSPGLPGKE